MNGRRCAVRHPSSAYRNAPLLRPLKGAWQCSAVSVLAVSVCHPTCTSLHTHGAACPFLTSRPAHAGPPPMMNAISGDKAKDKSQGELTGILKKLGYAPEQVFKF